MQANGGSIDIGRLNTGLDQDDARVQAAIIKLARLQGVKSPAELVNYLNDVKTRAGYGDNTDARILDADLLQVLAADSENTAKNVAKGGFYRWQEENIAQLALLAETMETAAMGTAIWAQNEGVAAKNANAGNGTEGTEKTGEPYSGTRNPSIDFKNAKGNSTLKTHFDDHRGDFGYTSEAEYLNGTRNFLEKPPNSTTQSFVSKDGTYFRYDTATNEFGIMNKYGGSSTYFKPERGIDYWLEQIELYVPKD